MEKFSVTLVFTTGQSRIFRHVTSFRLDSRQYFIDYEDYAGATLHYATEEEDVVAFQVFYP